MIDLSGVVSAISQRGLKLIRTANSIRVEGDCPAELATAIQHHSASLLPFAAIDPDAAEQIAQQQAAADSDSIQQQLKDFARWILQHHPWASSHYTEQYLDGRLAVAVDSQKPMEVAAEIVRLKTELNAIDWATHLFPLAMETEAKHAAGNCPFLMPTQIARSESYVRDGA